VHYEKDGQKALLSKSDHDIVPLNGHAQFNFTSLQLFDIKHLYYKDMFLNIYGEKIMTGSKKSKTLQAQSTGCNEAYEIFWDPQYRNHAGKLITGSLQKNHEVMQLPNGDILVTEEKIVTSNYKWDPTRQKMLCVTNATKSNTSDEVSAMVMRIKNELAYT
jgi:hypothetical protein